MSKPDPSITANLLNSVLGKHEEHHEDDPARPGKHAHAEGHAEHVAPKPPSSRPPRTAPPARPGCAAATAENDAARPISSRADPLTIS